MSSTSAQEEDEIVVKPFDYKGKSYYIDAANVIYDFVTLNKIGKLVGNKIVFIADTLNRLIETSRIDARINKHIEARDQWLRDARREDCNEITRQACNLQASIKEADIKMTQIEKLIYNSVISNKRELFSKYKEKYLSHTQQALEHWGTLTEIGAEDDGRYLSEANRLKEAYDFISHIIARY
jgi:hypothetical protein